MTIKAIFPDRTMMFGDSYKRWWIQLREYCREFGPPESFQVSRSAWIKDGLKWCDEADFPGLIADNGRDISAFKWREPTVIEQLIFEKYGRR